MATVAYYEKTVKSKFLRRSAHFIKPRILNANDWIFPIDSALYWWKVEDEPYYITKDIGYLRNIEKCQVISIFDYANQTEGKLRAINYVPFLYIKDANQKLKEWKFLKPKQEIACNNRTMKIVNFGPVPGKYRYTMNILNPYYKYRNMISSVIENLFTVSDRRSFLTIELPSNLPSRAMLDKYARDMKPAYLSYVKTTQDFNFLEFWKLFTPELKESSVFNKIPKDKWKMVDIIFVIDNKIMCVNYNTLLSNIENYGAIDTSIKSKKPEFFRKIFYKLVNTFATNAAMSEQELEQLEKDIDNNGEKIESDANKEIEEKQEEVKEEEVKEEKKVENIKSKWTFTKRDITDNKFRSFHNVIDMLKEQNKAGERAVNDGAPTRDKDTVMKDIDPLDDELNEDELDLELPDETEEIYNSLVDEINNNRDNIESELDDDVTDTHHEEDDTLLDKKLVQTELNIDTLEDIDIPKLDDIKEFKYTYNNVEEKITHLQENKVLDKKKAESMRNTLLKNLTKKDPYGSDKTVGDILHEDLKLDIPKEESSITSNKVVFDERYNNNVINTMRSNYIKNHYHDDIIRIIYSLQNYNVIIEDYKITPKQSALGDSEEHMIVFKTLDNKTSTVRLILPKIEDDGTFKISSNTYTMRWQRQDTVIRKIENGRVKLSSYYGKFFIDKAYYKKNDIGYYLMNQLSKRYQEVGDIKDLILMPSDNEEVKLPLDYSHFSRYIKSFKYKNYVFNFEYAKRANLFKNLSEDLIKILEKDNLVLVGVQVGVPILMDFQNRLFRYEDKQYVEIPNIYEILGIIKEEEPIEFSCIKIFKKVIPVAILLSYYYGLTNLLKILKLQYESHPVKIRKPLQPNQYVVKFKDVKLYITRDNGLGDMIISGLNSVDKILKDTLFKVMNDKSSFMALCSKLDYSILYINEIKRLEALFVDPISLSILEKAKFPTNFKGLLIKASEMLLDDYYNNPNNIKDMCIKGYERIAGMIYHQLIDAIRDYDNKSAFSKAQINVKPYSIISLINEDSTTVLVDDLNPIAAMKQTEDVSYLGSLGYNKEALARSSRIYNESEVGVISEAVKDSGDVGITAYMTAAPKIKDIRGGIDEFDAKKDGPVSTYSTSALLCPFSLSDDTKRLNFASIMKSHIIPINGMSVPYVRTGYEAIVPIRSNDKFVITAEDNGVVTKVSKTDVEVKYNKTTKKYKIKDWTTKEESGACYTHVMKSNVEVGDKVSKDDTIIYDQAFFQPDIFNPKRVIYREGTTINVALVENPETYEDSAAISQHMSEKLGTTVTKVKSIIIEAANNIYDVKKVGDRLEPNDTLLSSVAGGFLDKTLDARTLEILKNLKTSSPKAKVRGVITKIQVKYNCNLEDMSDTIREFTMAIDRQTKADTGFTGKIENGSYSINGNVLQPGYIEIKFYIQVGVKQGIGDKAIFANQLKFTVGEVFDHNITTEDGTTVDALFSYRSISARIVNSPLLMGAAGMVLSKLEDKAIDLYFK